MRNLEGSLAYPGLLAAPSSSWGASEAFLPSSWGALGAFLPSSWDALGAFPPSS